MTTPRVTLTVSADPQEKERETQYKYLPSYLIRPRQLSTAYKQGACEKGPPKSLMFPKLHSYSKALS